MAGSSERHDKNEEDLARLAREEILADTRRAKTRAETLGALGWRPCPLPKTNKRFIQNMIIGTVQANKRHKSQEGSKRTFLKVDSQKRRDRLHRKSSASRGYRCPSSLKNGVQSKVKTEKKIKKSNSDGCASCSNDQRK